MRSGSSSALSLHELRGRLLCDRIEQSSISLIAMHTRNESVCQMDDRMLLDRLSIECVLRGCSRVRLQRRGGEQRVALQRQLARGVRSVGAEGRRGGHRDQMHCGMARG